MRSESVLNEWLVNEWQRGHHSADTSIYHGNLYMLLIFTLRQLLFNIVL